MPELPVVGVSAVLSTNRSVVLRWNPPPRYSWRGVIYYNIIVTETVPSDGPSSTNMVYELTQLANNRDPSLASEPLETEQFTVTDLQESFVYYFSIQMANDAGNGDSSPSVMREMPENGKRWEKYSHARMRCYIE